LTHLLISYYQQRLQISFHSKGSVKLKYVYCSGCTCWNNQGFTLSHRDIILWQTACSMLVTCHIQHQMRKDKTCAKYWPPVLIHGYSLVVCLPYDNLFCLVRSLCHCFGSHSLSNKQCSVDFYSLFRNPHNIYYLYLYILGSLV